jgi:uncharacterized protein YbdZ (MbtH family)
MMSTNPFDDEAGTFVVPVNDEERHSLWPTLAEIPAGGRQVHGEASLADCLEYVEERWTDMRPKGCSRRWVRVSSCRFQIASQARRVTS